MAHLRQQFRTTHDTNGNPRRLWAVHNAESGDLVGVWDEGCDGKQCVPAEYRGAPELLPVVITPGEYRTLLRQHRVGSS